MAIKPIIVAKDASVTYLMGKSNEVKALQPASLEIYPGEFIIFFGPSGCGKSTLLYSIAGLERNVKGSIKVFDKEITELKGKELEKHYQKIIGMVFQAFYLIPSLSVIQNVMLPQVAVSKGLIEREKKASQLLEFFGVKPQANKLPTELSGGQQQRVAICRALVNDPEIILADEPVGNLDSKSAVDVLSLIQELNQKEKKTIILVTHDPSHLDIADRVFYMRDGQIIDVKANKNPRMVKNGKKKEKGKGKGKEAEVEKGGALEMLAKTFAKVGQGPISGLLLEYKAKQVVIEALTGLNSEEVERIEGKVKNMLIHGTSDHDELISMLDREEDRGGLGMDHRSATRLVRKIKETVKEINLLSSPSKKEFASEEQLTIQLRYFLLDSLDIKINNTESIDVINRVIRERIHGFTDKKGVRALLDAPISKGGAGFDKRDARKMARMLELVLLGKYSKRIDNPVLKKINITKQNKK